MRARIGLSPGHSSAAIDEQGSLELVNSVQRTATNKFPVLWCPGFRKFGSQTPKITAAVYTHLAANVPQPQYTKDRPSRKHNDSGEVDAASFVSNRSICKTDSTVSSGRKRLRKNIFSWCCRAPASHGPRVVTVVVVPVLHPNSPDNPWGSLDGDAFQAS